MCVEYANSCSIYGLNSELQNIFKNRKKSILTVCNHMSCMDDPLLWGSLDYSQLFSKNGPRWSGAANEICFSNLFTRLYFYLNRAVPIIRGGGIDQPGINFLIDRINDGSWVHVFPEGRVNDTNDYVRFKWGIGRIIKEATVNIDIIPIWHCGFQNILPNKTPYFPRFGKKTLVYYGKPISTITLKNKLKEYNKLTITDYIQNEMYMLKKKATSIFDKIT
ncbi:Tafazzin [Intoshia linei]|uniref:Tafazzin family protein n=1 Tax=Intoshia linei TaxID=1819745 RepID=A0A177AZS2_9BILA|nr:Tafazzin [Intoshia linei]